MKVAEPLRAWSLPRTISASRFVPSRSRLRFAVRASLVLCTHHAARLHTKAGHPEGPARVDAILKRLEEIHWIASLASSSPSHGSSPLLFLEGQRTASADELALVHPPAYVAAIEANCRRLTEATLVDDSTYLAPDSYHECARSVGTVLDLLDHLLLLPASPPGTTAAAAPAWPVAPTPAAPSTLAAVSTLAAAAAGGGPGDGRSGRTEATGRTAGHLPSSSEGDRDGDGVQRAGRWRAGFALVRPPGHHVLPERPMGFGVFNAVAVAAKYARQRYGVDRIMILDFDVHHGNGTMDIFYDDPRTLYVSTHQAGLWPYTGKARETGSAAGRGATINVPLPGGSGDAAMRQAWSRVVLPAAERFAPQLLLVSAGYDAHWLDPLAGMQLHAGTYHWMCSELAALSDRLCPGRLALVLEGGYHLGSLADSVVASLEGLAGAATTSVPPPRARDLYEEPLRRVDAALREVCALHNL